MRADLVLSPAEVGRHDLTGKMAIVIDVFRFTTTVLTALEAGMSGFLAVATVEQAWQAKQANPRLLLAGERQLLKVDGFDFGNSPLEHLGKKYAGEGLVCTTTNGTLAVQGAKGAQEIVLASLRSAQAVADYAQMRGLDLLFIPAGLEGKFSLEDTWCAGLILSCLSGPELSDAANLARLLCEHVPLDDLAKGEHGSRMQRLGLERDQQFCLECNVSSGVIIWDQNTNWGSLLR